MVRFILRCLAVIFLALAVIFAILDGARSVGASQFVSKPFIEILSGFAPQGLEDVKRSLTHYIGESGWENVLVPVISQPGWALFGILALLFYALGHRRERQMGRFAAR